RSETCSTFRCASAAGVTAVMATGTLSSFSSTRRAVTTISSRPDPSAPGPAAALVACAQAGAASATLRTAIDPQVIHLLWDISLPLPHVHACSPHRMRAGTPRESESSPGSKNRPRGLDGFFRKIRIGAGCRIGSRPDPAEADIFDLEIILDAVP